MKNNNHSYWFKRKKYGYGWTPVSWQGWLTVISFTVIILATAVILHKDTEKNSFSTESYIFLAILIFAAIVTVALTLSKGPKPKWRWGSKPTDNLDEDI